MHTCPYVHSEQSMGHVIRPLLSRDLSPLKEDGQKGGTPSHSSKKCWFKQHPYVKKKTKNFMQLVDHLQVKVPAK